MNSSKKYPKPKLVVCLSRYPWPLEKGDKLRAYHQIKDLSEKFSIFLICTNRQAVSEEHLQKLQAYCEEIHVFPLKKWLIAWNLFRAFFSREPFQIAFFTQKWIKQRIKTLLARIEADHLYCQLIRPAEYIKNHHSCSKTIDLMDALSKGMERRIEKAPGPFRFIFREENRRLINYERRILDYFESSTIISAQDKEFILHPDKKRIQVVPNGVDTDFFASEQLAQTSKQYDLVFVGNMQYPPNIEAAVYLAQNIMPALRSRQLKLMISGASPVATVKRLANEQVLIGGWIDDIRHSYAASKIFVAPMQSGTGMQNKLLEAMSMGLPCITTTLANNAILATPNQDILIGDTAEEMLKHIHHLLHDADFYQKMAENSRKFVIQNYNWEQMNKKLINVMENPPMNSEIN